MLKSPLTSVLELAILEIFSEKKILLDPYEEDKSKIMWYNGWDSILMFSLVSSKFLAMHNVTLYSNNILSFWPLIALKIQCATWNSNLEVIYLLVSTNSE